MTIFYHFTKDTLRDGSPLPPIGKWLHFKGTPIICEQGLHASRHVADALEYAPGSLLHKVKLKGLTDEQDDKVVARSRKIVATIDATEVLRHYARLCALDVIHLWDAPDVVRQYLETGDEGLREAAEAEARAAAARAASAASAAAASAAAARAAAWAAWAAEAAARTAVWAAEAEAARTAAWAAEAEAARTARTAAAWAAAWAAAAAWATKQKQRARLLEMVEAEFARTVK